MKKLVAVALVLLALLFCSQAQAAQTVEKIISSTLLNSATTAVKGATYIGDANKVAFFVSNAKSGNVSATITTQIASIDAPFTGDNTSPWVAASFYDFAGGPTTLKTWGSLSTTDSYYFWFSPDTTIPQVRLKIQGNALTGNSSEVISAYIIKSK